jgi:hypothetical protein
MDALAICRFAHFMAAAQVFGASAYLWLYARQDLRRALSPSIWRVAFAASLVPLLSAVLWLVLAAASMADDWRAAIDPGVIATVFADTDFGRVWLFRLFLAVALTAVVLLRPQQWATITIVAGMFLASLTLVGHAAMDAAAGAQDAAVQEPAVSPEFSFHTRRRLQHVQCSTPSRLSSNSSRASHRRDGHLADGGRSGLTIPQGADTDAFAVRQRDNARAGAIQSWRNHRIG